MEKKLPVTMYPGQKSLACIGETLADLCYLSEKMCDCWNFIYQFSREGAIRQLLVCTCWLK
jgi:hypothetical protein